MRGNITQMKQVQLFGAPSTEDEYILKMYLQINTFPEYFQCKTNAHEKTCKICRDIWKIFKFFLQLHKTYIFIDEAKPRSIKINMIEKNYYVIQLNFVTNENYSENFVITHEDIWVRQNIYLSDFFSSLMWIHFDDSINVNENIVWEAIEILNENDIVYDHPNQKIISIKCFNEEKCPVCLETGVKDFVHLEGCNLHIVHYNCLIKSLAINYMCPICRNVIN